MDIYICIAGLFFLFSFITYNKSNKKCHSLLLFSSIILIVFEGTRWKIGTDWDAYYNNFLLQEWSEHLEYGYVLLNKVIYSFSHSYTIFLIVLSSFFYISLYSLLRRYSVAPLMSLVIYFCSMMWLLGCNRQLIAMYVFLLSLKFAFENNLKAYLLCFIIGFSFHSTAIFTIPAFFLINKGISNRLIYISIVLALLIGLSGIVNNIPYIEYISFLDSSSSSKAEFYLDGDIAGYSYLGTLKRLFILIPCLLCRDKINNNYYSTFCILYATGCILFFVFNGSILQLIAARGALYFNVMEIFIIPLLIRTLFSNMSIQKIIWFLYFLLILYMMNRDMVSYADGYDGDIYRPYKSVLF